MNIGIDIGGSHIAVGVVDDKNNIQVKKEYNWNEQEKKDLLNTSKNYCIKLIEEILNENKNITIEKIGIGYPSENIINGIIRKEGISLNLPQILSDKFNTKVYVKNDVKCSSLCEKKIGSIKDYNNCIFMTLGTGIGGAYFYKNKLVVPNKYAGFEIGHMIIKAGGKECKCGRKGCFEQYASMKLFRKKIEELFNIKKVTSDTVFEIIKNKKKLEEVNEIIDNYIEYLSIGISNIINIFEPDAISIGGSFSYYAPIFLDKLKIKVQDNFKKREIPNIIIAKYANDAGIIGASMLNNNK